MQILGIGTDIIECPRIGKMIEQHGELFLRRVYTDLEVRNAASGQPQVLVRGGAKDATLRRGIGDIFLSISHCRTYATAYAVAVGPPALPADPAGTPTADEPDAGC